MGIERGSTWAFLTLLAGCGGGAVIDAGGMDAGPPDATAVDAPAAPDLGGHACTTAMQCDDGVYCNGAEQCVDGTCQAAVAVNCDDGMACSTDRCDEAAGVCRHTAADADGDGHGVAGCGGGDDCDDGDANRYPGNTEVCDAANHDEDCDPSTYGYRDLDGDGHASASCCNTGAAGAMICGDDCNDMSASQHPGLAEVCDGLDNDCNGMTDEGVTMTLYPDADGDGFGSATAMGTTGCLIGSGRVPDDTDCDDTRMSRHPGAPEVCDGLDNDCNGLVDDMTMPQNWYLDADGDGYGDAGDTAPVSSCAIQPGRATNDRDCDDTRPTVHPGASEACDGLDNDCNGMIDDGLGALVYYRDADGDGFGDASAPTMTSCHAIAGYVPNSLDCNDADVGVHPGAPDVCDAGRNVDQDCNPSTNPFDADGDHYDRTDCGGTDCNDANAAVYPGTSCMLANATSMCQTTGSCTLSCNRIGVGTTWLNCDGMTSTGCEVMNATDMNCRTCGDVCFAPTHCQSYLVGSTLAYHCA